MPTTTGTPRSDHSVVRLSEPTFTGEMHTLCTLPITPTSQMLRRLIAGDQLAVTRAGSQMAMVHTNDHDEEVSHTGFDMRIRFLHPPSKDKENCGTRILQVGESHAMVWGHVHGYTPGVWLLTSGVCKFLFPMDRIKGSYMNGTVRMPVGESVNFPGDNVIITPWGLLPVKPGAKVELYADGTLCIVEELDGRPYAYQISAEGITPFSSCMHGPVLRLVRFQGQHLLATRTPHRSLFVCIGKQDGFKDHVFPIDGQLEEVWSSPTAKALLTLVRPRDATQDVHRLFFNHDTLVFEGRFSLTRRDVIWSRSGSSFAARLHVTSDGKTY
ncbi:MAG: hypothetical protein WC654_06225, partial [Patescibacteria group bacterium]